MLDRYVPTMLLIPPLASLPFVVIIYHISSPNFKMSEQNEHVFSMSPSFIEIALGSLRFIVTNKWASTLK